MKFINEHGPIKLAHFPGTNTQDYYESTIISMKEFAIPILPRDTTLITVASKNRDDYLLIEELHKFNVPYINDAEDYSGEWKNTIKIKFILSALEKVSTTYVLIADALDVLLFDCSNIIDLWKKEYPEAKLVFNSVKSCHPAILIDTIPERVNWGKSKYLNAGVAIGEKDYAIDFYTKALSCDLDNPYNSEQLAIRQVFADNYDKTTIDWKCILFQTMIYAKLIKDLDTLNILLGPDLDIDTEEDIREIFKDSKKYFWGHPSIRKPNCMSNVKFERVYNRLLKVF